MLGKHIRCTKNARYNLMEDSKDSTSSPEPLYILENHIASLNLSSDFIRNILILPDGLDQNYLSLLNFGFRKLIESIPINLLVDLFRISKDIPNSTFNNMIEFEFEFYIQRKGNLAEKIHLMASLQEFSSRQKIQEIIEGLVKEISNIRAKGEQNENYVEDRRKYCNNFDFVRAGEPKALRFGRLIENGSLNFSNASPDFPINAAGIAFKTLYREHEYILQEKEVCYYRLSSNPSYYGFKPKIDENQYKILYFDECCGTLQENLNDFHKKAAGIKSKLKQEREALAFHVLKQMVEDLNLLRSLNLFHMEICPDNIFMFKDKNDPEKINFKLLGGKFLNYKRNSEGFTEETKIDKEFVDATKIFCSPEVFNSEKYMEKMRLNPSNTNPNISDVFSLGAIILLIVTNKSKDQWNNLNFKDSLKVIINKEIQDIELKRYILSMTEFDYLSRIKLEVLAEQLKIF